MRKEGWEKILDDYFASQRNEPFLWGENDCVLFAARCALKIIDRDLSAELLQYGKYDKLRAYEIIKENGGSIAGIFDKYFSRKLKTMAQRGDIALVNHNGSEAAGVVSGFYVICKSLDGIAHVHRDNILKVWDIV